MDRLQKIVSVLAGGFSEVNVNCVVCIDVKDQESKYLMVQSAEITTETPDSILKDIADACNVEIKDIIVTVYQLCGGMNGSKLMNK